MARFPIPRQSNGPTVVSAGKQPRNFSNRPQANCHRRLPMPVTPTSSASQSLAPGALAPSPPTVLPLATQSPLSVAGSPSTSSSPLADISNQAGEATELRSFIGEQRDFNKRVLNLLTQESQEKRPRTKRLPASLKSNVRTSLKNIYGNDIADAWDLNESFCSTKNEEVNVKVTAAVQNVQKISSSLIRDALRVYYKSRKRQFKMSSTRKQQYLMQQRSRTRINSKRHERMNSLEQSAYSPEAKERYRQVITNDFMSSEESGEEDMEGIEFDSEEEEDTPRTMPVLAVKSLPWRSREVGDLFTKLDKKNSRKRSRKGQSMVIKRVQSPVASSRTAPEDAPQWALHIRA